MIAELRIWITALRQVVLTQFPTMNFGAMNLLFIAVVRIQTQS